MAPANLGMKLGFDSNGVYITFIVMTGDTHTMHGCLAIPKADVLAAQGPVLANVQSFTDLEIESFPATDLDAKKSGRRSGNPPEPRVRKQLFEDVPVQDHLVRKTSHDFARPKPFP